MFTISGYENFYHLPRSVYSSFKHRLITSVVVFLSMFSTGVILFVYPNWQTLERIKSDIGQVRIQIKDKNVELIKHTRLIKLQQNLNQSLSPFYIQQPIYLITTRFITEIEQWSKEDNLQLYKVTWGDLNEKEHMFIQPVNLRFIGTYQQLILLFKYIGKYYGFVEIIEFKISHQTHVEQNQNKRYVPQLLLELKLQVVVLKNTQNGALYE